MTTDLDAQLSEVIDRFGSTLQRLARSYEHDPSRQQDLVQEVLIGVARALPAFEGRSSLRTFVLRIAHNVGITHSLKARRDRNTRWVSIDDLAMEPTSAAPRPDAELDQRQRLARLQTMIASLKPADRQLTLLLLEGLPTAEIAEITGLSPSNVTTKVSRIRAVLRTRLRGDA